MAFTRLLSRLQLGKMVAMVLPSSPITCSGPYNTNNVICHVPICSGIVLIICPTRYCLPLPS